MNRLMKLVPIAIALWLTASACSTDTAEPKRFDDSRLRISLLSSAVDESHRTYAIRIDNAGELPLYPLSAYLSFPVRTESGAKENPYRLEGKAAGGRPDQLGVGEWSTFDFLAPVGEVSGESELLDNAVPAFGLKGYTKPEGVEIPFELSGGLQVFIEDTFRAVMLDYANAIAQRDTAA